MDGADQAGPATPSARSPLRQPRAILVALVLAALTAAVYGRVVRHDFVSLDDTVYVTENEHVARGLTLSGVVWAFTSFDVRTGNWHPVTYLSHMLDVELFGMRAGAHHLVSLAFHALNTVVLFWLLASLTSHSWRSAFVAALFALHPLHVESVAWIAERKDVLSTLFWFLTTAAYVGYVRRPRRSRYATVLLLFALALMAKPMVVTLPFTLLLLDWWPLARVGAGREGTGGAARLRAWGPLALEKWPLFAMSAASAVVTVVAQRAGGAVVALDAIPIATRAANALVSYGTYAWQTVWPFELSVFYPHRGSVSPAAVAAALAFVIAMSVAAWRLARTRGHVTVGWLWYLGTLVPVIGLVQVGMQSHADRYSYVPLVGLFVAAVWECARWVAGRRVARAAAGVTVCAVIVALGAAARAQVAHWSDDQALWRHALDLDADNYYAHYSLGKTDLRNGRRDDAARHLERALALAPWFAEVHDTMGLAHARAGRFDAAIAAHREALRLEPGLLGATFNLGLAYEQRGDLDLAAAQYRQAIALAPRDAKLRAALGHLLGTQGRLDAATDELREALRLDPDSIEARFGSASLLAQSGQVEGATSDLERLVQAAPDFTPAHSLLASLLLRRGRADDAIRHLREVTRLQPDSSSGRAALGAALADSGRLDGAIVEYAEAVRLAPADPELRHSLGLCLARHGRIAEAIPHFRAAADLRPDSDVLQTSLGMALGAVGDVQGAVARLNAALRLNPGNQTATAGLQALGGRTQGR